MAQRSEHDAQILLAAVERGLITDRVAVEVGARATSERPVETLLVSEGHLSPPQVTTLLGQLAAARVKPPAVLGNYRIIDQLGQGGMATVYKAEQLSLGRTVALKIIGPPHTQDAGFCERFLREARLVAAVNHPNVITCFDAGQDQGFLYMALELVTGGDAGKAVTADGGRLEEKRALTIASDCCQGLIALEAGGLIHRDIKPANIFLCPTPTGERAKLADLGLARASNGDDQMTATGASMGTPAFMSPEQANGTEVDIRTDIYSLGATLYALLTGKSPYQGTTVWSVMAQVIKDPVPDPRTVQPAISNASASVVMHCLAKDRNQRYASPRQLLEDLEDAAAGRTLRHARLVPHPSRSWEPLTAAGPVPRHASRDQPTVNLKPRVAPSDRPRDELGVDEPGSGARWLLFGVLAGALVVGLGVMAAQLAPSAPVPTPVNAEGSVETDLAALSDPTTDPLRPRPAPPDGPLPSHPFGPADLATPVAQPPLAPAAAPPVEVVAADPEPPTIAVSEEMPQAQVPPEAPVVEPTPPEVAIAVESSPEPPDPAELPAEPVDVASTPIVPTPSTAEIAPTLNLAAITAYARTREQELNRNGFRCRVTVLPSGNVAVTLLDPGITDLGPLHGLKIEQLDASGCDRLAGDLSVLTGMPLRRLVLTGCKRLTSLRGVRGAPIEALAISGCTQLGPDLSQLTGAKLSGRLDLTLCRGLTSLDGLRNQALTEVVAKDCDALTSLAGLRGTSLTRLDLRGCSALTSLAGLEGLPLTELLLDGAKRLGGDLRAVRGAPLRVLSLRDCAKLSDLDGLQGAPLTSLELKDCDSLLSVTALRGCKLTRLDLSGCASLRSLDGLQGVPLVELRLYGCRALTGDFTAVRGAPLRLVDASYCSQMTSLRGLEQSPLRTVILTRNTGITDYTVLAGVKGLEIVR